MRNLAGVEIVAGIESTVAKKFVCAAMELIRARSRDDIHLSAGTLTVFGAIGVFDHLEFADSVHTQQLSTRTARSGIDVRRSGVLESVKKIKVVLRPTPRDGKHVTNRRSRRTDAAGSFACDIDDPGIQRQQVVEAAAVQRQFLYFSFADQARDVRGRCRYLAKYFLNLDS